MQRRSRRNAEAHAKYSSASAQNDSTESLQLTSLARPTRPRASHASGFDVAIKARVTSPPPVSILVIINPWPGVQNAEERVPRRPDDNPHVPAPHHQNPRLRPP